MSKLKDPSVCARFEQIRELLSENLSAGGDISDPDFILFSRHMAECSDHIGLPKPEVEDSNEQLLADAEANPTMLTHDEEFARKFLEAVDIKGRKQ